MDTHAATQMTFGIVPGRSAVLVKARSNVGPISFATSAVEGLISATVQGGNVDTGSVLEGRLTVALDSLTSGNSLYDSEIRRRIDARRYPLAIVTLLSAMHTPKSNRYELSGEIELHNVVRTISGSVAVEFPRKNTVVIRGEQTFDIRDFNLEVPATLALKIYPDVWVEMHLEAQTQ